MQIGGLTWDEQGKHYYYTGIDAVALYVWETDWYGKPVAWNGVTAVNESPSGAESNKLYADNIEYLNLLSKEEFGLTVECYQTPGDNGSIKGFDWCDGVVLGTSGKVKVRGQARRQFGLAYRVRKGSDTVEAGGKVEGNTKGDGYVYHIVYGCKASPSSRDFATVNDSPEAQTFSYEISTTALSDTSKFPTSGGKAMFNSVAHLEIDATTLTTAQETALKNLLFNNSGTQVMPTPAEIAAACGYTSN